MGLVLISLNLGLSALQRIFASEGRGVAAQACLWKALSSAGPSCDSNFPSRPAPWKILMRYRQP
jgi:hypothetical protein